MKVAAVNVGAAALQLSVATVVDSGEISILGEFSRDTYLLDNYTPSGHLDETAMERTVAILKGFRHILRNQTRLEQTRIFGTSLLKDAANIRVFSDAVRQTLDAPLEIVTPTDEAAYGFLGTHDSGLPPEGGLVVTLHVGDAATELAVGDGERLVDAFALSLGEVALDRRFLDTAAPATDRFLALSEHLHTYLNLAKVQECIAGRPFILVGSGGIVQTLRTLSLDDGEDDLTLDTETLYEWYNHLGQTPAEERVGAAGLSAPRARSLLAGVGILLFAMDKLGATGVIASRRGPRHGCLRELLGIERNFL
jgi:exopolyphosphatase/guanosine-5'-triphosphate,3'-diphosphate pyrophosphatase